MLPYCTIVQTSSANKVASARREFTTKLRSQGALQDKTAKNIKKQANVYSKVS